MNIRVARNLTVVANSTLGNTYVTGSLTHNGTDIRAVYAQNTSTQLAIATKLSVANAVATYQTKTVERAALANTNLAIATKLSVANAVAIYQTKAVERAALANTNLAIAAKLAVSNAAATYQTKAVERAALANTNAYIATKLDSSTYTSGIAARATWTALTSTNTAIRALVSDRLQVANAAAIYQTKTVERAALANTNLAIATKLAVSNAAATYQTKVIERAALANTNLAIATKLSVANAVAIYQTKVVERAALANTNLAIATKLSVANAAVTYQTKAIERAALANTNLAIATKLSVANAAAIYQTKTVERAALANTNLYIATKLSVANATSTYATKANPTTSALWAHTGRATISTNLVVSGNTTIAGLNANNSLGSPGQVLKSNGTTIYWGTDATGSGGGGGGTTTATVQSKTVKDLTQTDTVVTSVVGLLYPNANVITKSLDSIKGSDQVVTSVTGLLAQMTPYLQVANAVATYTTKAYAAANTYVKSTLANTNAYIATRASWTELKATNTAIRVLDTAKLSVANAVATYATKASPTTSGLLAHTGRATISTNLDVSGNTTVSTHIITPNRHGSRVYGSGTTNNLGTTVNTTGKLNNNNFAIDYNQGGCLHANTGIFTARVAGLYQVCMNVRNAGYASGISQLICYKNKGVAGEAVQLMVEFGSSSSMNHTGCSTMSKLAAGDTLSLYVGAGQINFDGNDNWSVTHIG
jgi:hypothetical protein